MTAVHAGPATTRYDYDAADNRSNVSACNTEQPLRRSEAESLPHVIGSVEPGGWRANPANGQNAMSYGPLRDKHRRRVLCRRLVGQEQPDRPHRHG